MNTHLMNKYKLTILKLKYGKHLEIKNSCKILGNIPYFKSGGGKLYIGDRVVINSDFKNTNTALTYRCKFVVGYTGEIRIGNNTMLNGVSITAYNKVTIGANCQIASGTFISDTDFHPVDPSEREKQVTGNKYNIDTVNKKPVILGNNVWIGWGSIILKGTEVGDNSIVAAGSVVLGRFPANVIIAGNPAKIVKQI